MKDNEIINSQSKVTAPLPHREGQGGGSVGPIWSVLKVWWDELCELVKDEGILIFIILMPLAYPLLYAMIYNTETQWQLPICVVDDCMTDRSRDFIRRVDATPEVVVAERCASMADAQELLRRREAFVSDFPAFAKTYVQAFERKLAAVQASYRARRRGFDELFVHRPYDLAGSGAFRWTSVLARLDACDPAAVADALKKAIQA